MKHIKLFEQFVDSFDPFGEETRPYNGELKIIRYPKRKNLSDKNGLYIMEYINSGGFVVLFRNHETLLKPSDGPYGFEYVDLKDILNEDKIYIFEDNYEDEDDEDDYGDEKRLIKFENLPKEIKDRLV